MSSVFLFSKKLHPQHTPESVIEFKKLKNEIGSLTKEEKEKIGFKEFDHLSWIESKIENRTFAEIVKEKSRI